MEELKYAIRSLTHRRLRSFLTILSILIGITAIFALISFGLGINDYIDTLAQESGVDKLFLQSKGTSTPGTDANFYISEEDLHFINKINGVNELSGIYMSVAELEFRKDSNFYFVMGMEPKKMKLLDETFTVSVEKGRNLKVGDLNKVVLGYNYQLDKKIFDHGIKLGDKVKLNKLQFEVIGFYGEIGTPRDDSQMYVAQEAFETLLYPESKDKFGYAVIRADSNIPPNELADKINEKLRKHKGQKEGEEDFFVQTFEDAIGAFTSIIDILNGVLILIALISLFVASINIMNTMYTAVLERTKEIGIMKSIGAKNKSILLIFILESGFLGLVGGILGIFIGWIIASMGGKIASSAGYAMLQPIFPWYLIAGCLFFAFFIGTLAGLLPAKQAAKLKPVDALRYE